MGKRLTRFVAALAACASILLAVSTLAQDKKPPAEYTIGEMHIQTIGQLNCAYSGQQTSFGKLADTINQLMPILTKALDEAKIRQNGPVIFTYTGMDVADMSKPFTLDVGVQTTDDAKPTDTLKVRKLAPFKCATMLYTGNLANFPKTYEKLIPAAQAAGLKLTGTSREFYLYWEGPDSKNNIVQVQLGIE